VDDSKVGSVCQGADGDWLVEGWEFDEVVVGDAFYGVTGFAPGAQASGDDVDFES
jgi:hypothetical protein